MGHEIIHYSPFLLPEIVQDTPRLFTAIAEWLAVMMYVRIYKKRYTGKVLYGQCILSLIVLILFQYMAGHLPLLLWIPAMLAAVGIMYGTLYLILDAKPRDCGVLVVHAFVLAELAASLYAQIYTWFVLGGLPHRLLPSTITMLVIYVLIYGIFFKLERGNIPSDRDLNISRKELFSVVITGVAAFGMSNLSFVNTDTPFSTTGNLPYVRTLVDFGGFLMLMTQMERRNELAIREENDAINQLFSRQYEQYRLAIDNSEALRKEMHDMKHYVIALKNEDDPEKRAAVMADMEQAIAIQESFMNTGNKVLDVILTTKSLQCERSQITLNAMVDGDVLENIHVKDICSLFGNLLDNAIEASQLVQSPDNRLIALSLRRQKQFIVVECENYSENENVRLKEESKGFFSGALPKTTKSDNVHHGFGLKSINQVAEKYGGVMNVSFDKGWFKVKVLLPVTR